jgi:LacI family transcriptional regulator
MNGRVTMTDIARKAGVHVTTVSLALRNHPSLPAATRERLQRLAKEMGYQPDPALSALVAYRHGARRKQATETLAYLTHWDTPLGWQDHPAHLEFFTGAQAKSATLGYKLEHFWLGEPGLTPQRMGDILHSRGITGLVLASHGQEAGSLTDFDWSSFSAVKIDYVPRELQLHMVTNDQSAIIRLAMQRILAAGYRRIGLVMPRWWDEFVNLAWSAGFLADQQRLAPKQRIPILYYAGTLRPEVSRRDSPEFVVPKSAFAKWLDAHRPEVLVSYGPFVRPCLAALGLSVPKDLAFVEIFLETTDGRTAGVRQNCQRVGELAVEILAGQLHQHVSGVPSVPTATYVEGTWFDGESLPKRPSAADR